MIVRFQDTTRIREIQDPMFLWFQDFRTLCFFDFRILGFQDSMVLWFQDSWILCFFDIRISGLYSSTIQVFEELCKGTHDSSILEPMILWFYDSSFPWLHDSRIRGIQDFKFPGPLKSRIPRFQDSMTSDFWNWKLIWLEELKIKGEFLHS